jgi:hypothetical protein
MNTRISNWLRLPLMIVAIVTGLALFQEKAAAQPCNGGIVKIIISGMDAADLPLSLPLYNQNGYYSYNEEAAGGGPTNLGPWTGVQIAGIGNVPFNGQKTFAAPSGNYCFQVSVYVDVATGCRTILIQKLTGSMPPC